MQTAVCHVNGSCDHLTSTLKPVSAAFRLDTALSGVHYDTSQMRTCTEIRFDRASQPPEVKTVLSLSFK